ncbi:hypothetical protein GDO78_016021 [Eleutherodactylus coqui]|uniref:Replication factor A C-terminal domain-containing protein n=2 Tax=Eleutherodactylus coqui TaxID=57060 RepID=A0A8J6EL84_ELECQ|nr:hypothetical protein GDO78_016021 [Eleutherodactylus coqui]
MTSDLSFCRCSGGAALMNVQRRFLLGTVLSIQDRSFIYPACQNCCSRLILTACSRSCAPFPRYECHKCGTSYKEAAHRYKLCMKVSEERRLHIITVFGKCVEKLFGASANSLHSRLQDSSQLSRDLEDGDAQDLLFQAVERCLIGRSFIFAVKMPENVDRSDSLHVVACQIIFLHDDPTSCTVLSYFNQLVAPVRSKNSINLNIDVSTETTNQDLELSEGDSSLQQSWSRYADYWQQSLGLVSSPLGNTLSQHCSFQPSECSRAESVLYPEALTPLNTTVSTQKKMKGTDTVTHCSSILSISTPRVKCSSSEHLHTNAPHHSPQNSSHFQSFSSKSEKVFGQESYLQNICKSGSQRSQSCSMHSMQVPPQPAEIHQAKEEIWEDFPFSESLSEFIAKIEDHEDIRHQLTAKESTSTSDRKEGRRPSCSLMNLPDAQPTINYTVGKQTPHCNFDEDSNTHVFNHHSKGTRRDGTSLVAKTCPSADLSTFQESFEKSNLLDALSRASAKEQNWQSPTCPKMLSNGMYISDGLEMCSFIDDLEKSAMSLGDLISSCRHVDDEPKSSDEDNTKITSEVKSAMTGDNYNASADLFEVSNNPEDDGTSHSQCIDRGQGRLLFSISDSPCTGVLPHRRRVSRISVSSSSEAWKILPIGGFIPNMQSTPILRRLSHPNRLTIDTWRINTGSNLKSSTVSIRTKSTSTIRYIFLKNMRQRKSTIFYGLPENYSLWSPTLPPFLNPEGSTALTPKYRRTLPACQPAKGGTVLENTENYSNQTCHEGSDDKDTMTGREGLIKHVSEALDTSDVLSPGNRLVQEGEDGLCSAQLLPSDWSPELFSGKLNVSPPSDRLQRRLF